MNATAPLSPEVMNKIRRIEIRTRHKVEDLFAGSYLSVFKGRGIEFDEVRPYQAGDDVRTVDWNVTARMGELYVKRFIEERELTLLLMVDVSGSQDFGSVSSSNARLWPKWPRCWLWRPIVTTTRWVCCSSAIALKNTFHRAKAASTCCGWCANC